MRWRRAGADDDAEVSPLLAAAASVHTRRPRTTVAGPARVDPDINQLVRRLAPGEIAVVDAPHLRQVEARGLIDAGVAAVVNCSVMVAPPSEVSGASELSLAGVPVVDGVGSQVLHRVADGDRVTIIGPHVLVGDLRVGSGHRHEAAELRKRQTAARESLGDQLEEFASDSLDALREHRELIVGGVHSEDVFLDCAGRHVLVVLNGPSAPDELATLRHSGYVGALRPLVVGVDRGVGLALAHGVRPDVAVGDLCLVGDDELRKVSRLIAVGGEKVVVESRNRVDELGLRCEEIEVPLPSEDAAVLLAHEGGAELIVVVGDRAAISATPGAARMAPSTYAVRMRVGATLVDATGVSRLYRTTVQPRELGWLVLAAVAALVVIFLVSEPLQTIVRGFWITL
ncbi:MAG: putative cytokinetic ring protein SteA [Actinomycetota bacterium]|nr:putative cytokinetic ring protein SteA [Actinomycetota bacterium]